MAYSLWMYKRVMFGEVAYSSIAALNDLNLQEKLVFTLLAGIIIAVGVWPNPIFELMHSTTAHLVTQLMAVK